MFRLLIFLSLFGTVNVLFSQSYLISDNEYKVYAGDTCDCSKMGFGLRASLNTNDLYNYDKYEYTISNSAGQTSTLFYEGSLRSSDDKSKFNLTILDENNFDGFYRGNFGHNIFTFCNSDKNQKNDLTWAIVIRGYKIVGHDERWNSTTETFEKIPIYGNGTKISHDLWVFKADGEDKEKYKDLMKLKKRGRRRTLFVTVPLIAGILYFLTFSGGS